MPRFVSNILLTSTPSLFKNLSSLFCLFILTITFFSSEIVDFVFENDVELDRRQLAYKLINVDDSKKELLLIASKNARARADVLVSGSGSKIGTLLDASQGAFSIQAKDSVGDSDYGSIDISSIEKTIRVVVTMTYEIIKE